MKQNEQLSFSDEVKKEAEEIEQIIADNPGLTEVSVSNTFDREFLAKVKEYEKGRTQQNNSKEGTADADYTADVEFAEEFVPNFLSCTNDSVLDILSDEDKRAILVGREVLKCGKAEGEPLHIPNPEIHKHLNEPETKIIRMPRKKKILFALVATMVLVIGMGVTSVGSKSYLKVLWEKVRGGQTMQVANVGDMDSKEIEDGDELAALELIKKELHVLPVRLGYKPDGMFLERYEINKEQGQAILFYKYKDEVIRYYIYLNAEDSSLSQRETDKQLENFTVKSSQQEIVVIGYEINEIKSRFIAEFEFQGVNYEMNGILEKPEMINILEKLNYIKDKS